MSDKFLTPIELEALEAAKREALTFDAGHLDRDTVEEVAREEMPWAERIVYVDNLSDVPAEARVEVGLAWCYWLPHRIYGHYITGDESTFQVGKVADVYSEETKALVHRAERLYRLVRACGAILSTEDCTLYVLPVPEVHWSDDEPAVLHNPSGPATVFGGVKRYYWRGVAVPEAWIAGGGPTVADALTHSNSELRRCAAEILGWEAVLKAVNARVIHEDPDPEIGTLLEADLPDSPGSRFLRVKCGTGRMFVIPVPPDVESALQANARIHGVEEGWESWAAPAIRT